MGNQVEHLYCPHCKDMIGKVDHRTKTCVPKKKPFRIIEGKGLELTCAKCNRLVVARTIKENYNPLSLPKR